MNSWFLDIAKLISRFIASIYIFGKYRKVGFKSKKIKIVPCITKISQRSYSRMAKININ